MNRIICIKLEAAASIETLQAVAARCKQFTPLVGIDPDVFPQSVLLDITKVLDLFGGEAALVERIGGELRAGGWPARIAVADTCGAAWALAWYGRKAEWESGRVGDGEIRVPHSPTLPLSHSLLPLPLPALRLPEPIIALLHSLGVWRIEQLQALPRRELSSRFGPELLDCLDRVTGLLPEPLPAWDPPPQFEVRWSAEFPTARRETIDAALEHLTRRLAGLLTRAGRGAMRLECRLNCLDSQTLDLAVGLFRPTAWANHLLQLLQVRFESLQLPGPVESMRLAAVTAPLELRQQEMFGGKTRIQPYHLAGLIDRLSNRLGHTRVARVRLIPEAQPELACHYAPLVEIKGSVLFSSQGRKTAASDARRRSTKSFRKIELTPLFRPLRLLTEPVRLSGDVRSQFTYAGRQHRIVRRIGPERIETGWWRGHTVARDYYRIETSAGCCYWIFRRLPGGPWFVHGVFE